MRRLAFLGLLCLLIVSCGGSSKRTGFHGTFTGQTHLIIIDNPPTSTEEWVLDTGSHRYKLSFARRRFFANPEENVTVRGNLVGHTIFSAVIVSRSSTKPAAAQPTLSGTVKVSWIEYTWTGGPAVSYTNAEIKERGYAGTISVAKFYEADSFGKFKIEGHAYGPYTTTGVCEAGETEAITKATADGYQTGGYIQFLTPEISGSCTSGHAEVNGKVSRLHTSLSPLNPAHHAAEPEGLNGQARTWAHELGHNFGWRHAHSKVCGSGTTGLAYTNAETGCVFHEYGNEWDLMGGEIFQVGAVEKMRQGWWEPSQIKTVTTTGNYTVEPDETNVAGIHLLAIKRPNGSYYYVEYHQPLEPFFNKDLFDTKTYYYYKGAVVQVGETPGANEGTSVPNGPEQIFLEPNPPEPGSAKEVGGQDWFPQAAALREGKTYTNSSDGIKLKTESLSSENAVVKVTFEAPVTAPTGLTAVGVSGSQVALTWTPVPGAANYKVFRGGVEVGKTTLAAPHYMDYPTRVVEEELEPILKPSTTYSYCVKTVVGESESSCSGAVNGKTLAKEETGGVFGWVSHTGGITPIANALVSVKRRFSTELAHYANTNSQGFYFAKKLNGTSNPYNVITNASGFYTSKGLVVVKRELATPHNVNMGLVSISGINSHASYDYAFSDAEVEHELEEAYTLGVTNIRVPVSWSGIEHTKAGEGTEYEEGTKSPNSRLARLDKIVELASNIGIKINGTIVDTPPWASGHTSLECESKPCWSYAPTTISSVKPFARFIAKRYNTKLAALGVLNEPNNTGNYVEPSGKAFANMSTLSAYYTKEANAIYEGAHEGFSEVKVMAAETGFKEWETYVKDIIADGVKMDALGFHAYAEGGPMKGACPNTTECKVKAAEKLTSLPIWLNEWGYPCKKEGSKCAEVQGTWETTRAGYTKEGVELLNNRTTLPHIEGWDIYQLRDEAESTTEPEDTFGLLKNDFTPREAFAAFESANK